MPLALMLSAGAACKKERPVPPGPGGLPPLASAERRPADPAGMMHAPSRVSEAMPPDHPPVLKGSEPVPDPAVTPPDPNARIGGSIQLGAKVKDKVQAGATIFLVARAFPQGGPPLAAKKLVAGTWPLPFELTAADVMMAGTAFKGKVVLSARVDQDGDAMTKQPGDVEGTSKPVEVGAAKVEIALDTLRTEAAGAPSPEGLGGGLPPGHP